jgi:RIO kinase 2
VFVIDFPQMVSISHRNAQFYFDRDVGCIQEFFGRKFTVECTEVPILDPEGDKPDRMDITLRASGCPRLKDETESEEELESGEEGEEGKDEEAKEKEPEAVPEVAAVKLDP